MVFLRFLRQLGSKVPKSNLNGSSIREINSYLCQRTTHTPAPHSQTILGRLIPVIPQNHVSLPKILPRSNLSTRLFSSGGQEFFIPAAGLLPLNDLRDRPGSKRQKKRVGRGIGSGRGKTSGRGHKGQKARSGRKPRIGFEGGQTPLRLTLPKRGFHNPFKMEFQGVNLNRLAEKIEQGKIDPEKVITMKTLKDAGAVGKAMRDGVKLLGRGSDDFKFPINIEVSRVTQRAKASIEAAGGTVTRVHYNKLGLRALLKPEWFVKKGRLLPRPARPPPKLRNKVDAIGTLPPPHSIYEKKEE